MNNFMFEIDGVAYWRQFYTDTKLEDVRKTLVENREGWKAEKLIFRQGKMRIDHKDESNYTLEKLRNFDNSTIVIENLLKKTKVHIDEEVSIHWLDPEDKLEVIRNIFKDILVKNGRCIEFNFRRKSGELNSESGIKFLKETLINGNELYISTLQEKEIIVYSFHEDLYRPFKQILNKNERLSLIRKKHEKTWTKQVYLYMCPKCYFVDQEKKRISQSDEEKLILDDILSIENDNYVLTVNICREHYLINKCRYGFTINNGLVEQATHCAFKIVNVPECYFNNSISEGIFECKNEFQELYKRNFITFVNNTSILPWVSIFGGVDHESSLKKLEDYKKVVKYSYLKLRLMDLNVSSNISLTTDFVDAVKKALNKITQAEKVSKKLRENTAASMQAHYQHLETEESDTAIYKNLETEEYENTKYSNKCLERDTIKGGDISKFKLNDRSGWISGWN
ncbi:22877_t:CDS:2, partial [Gigaspora margarita]